MSVYTEQYGLTYEGVGASPDLTPGQYSIGLLNDSNALIYGGLTPASTGILISQTEIDTGSMAVQDQAVVGHDGQLFGIDTLPGMIITQTGWAYTPGLGQTAMDSYATLAGKWNDPAARLSNGTVQVLRAYYPGSGVVRRCYGRGRKIAYTLGMVNQGAVGFTAQFQAADSSWYSDTEFSVNLTQKPSFAGTLTPPMTPPLQLAATTNFQQNTAQNTGSMPTWPVITFTGPCSFPGLTYVNTPVTIGYNGSLRAGDSLVINTRPWVRTIKLNGKSVAGLLTGDPMVGLQLMPGSTLMHYTGQDFTGTATCIVQWRNASPMIGGTTA